MLLCLIPPCSSLHLPWLKPLLTVSPGEQPLNTVCIAKVKYTRNQGILSTDLCLITLCKTELPLLQSPAQGRFFLLKLPISLNTWKDICLLCHDWCTPSIFFGFWLNAHLDPKKHFWATDFYINCSRWKQAGKQTQKCTYEHFWSNCYFFLSRCLQNSYFDCISQIQSWMPGCLNKYIILIHVLLTLNNLSILCCPLI